jgi:hypothetical protein
MFVVVLQTLYSAAAWLSTHTALQQIAKATQALSRTALACCSGARWWVVELWCPVLHIASIMLEFGLCLL